jgi:hypothetical protein
MQEQHLYEYAVIRVVPRVDREEFINVGVVVYCARKKFLKAVYVLDQDRLAAFSVVTDLADIRAYLDALVNICAGTNKDSPISRLPVAERFRWLTATRSTVVQTSKVHPGFCSDPAEVADRLFVQLVL